MEKTKKRIDWLDMAKGYGMLAVIYAHLYNVGLRSVLYIFHMPLFIFLSGYTYRVKDNWKTTVINKARRLLIPYIIFGILGGFVDALCNNEINSMTPITILVKLLFQRRYLIVWYIMMIFFVEIIMYFPIKYIKNDKKLFVLSATIYIIGRIYFFFNPKSEWILNIDTCFTCQFWFTLGYLLSKKYVLNNNKIKFNIKVSGISFIIMLMCGAINHLITGKNLNIFGNVYALPLITEIGAISGILLVISISKIKTFKFIKFIGTNSLLFMLIHPMIIDILQLLIFKNYIKYLDNLLGAIITFVITIIFITLLTICYNKFIKNRSKKNYVAEG